MKQLLFLGGILAMLQFSIASCFPEANGEAAENKPVKVELKHEDGQYTLLRNGVPFYVKGAGFEGKDPSSVARHGGNTIRTWRTGDAFITGQEMLDAALEHGLMVCMGLEVGRERHGFDYNDPEQVQEQFERIKAEVLQFKDHPALLAWGIGNELNLHYENLKVWDAVNDISKMIHELDPYHLTTTMLAGAGKQEIQAVSERAPDLDFLSFQLYGDIVNLPRYIKEANYEGAYLVTEWGATGHWEVATTSWGRPYEQNSHTKAESYLSRYQQVIASDKQHCLGSFVFLWGQKQERTPTWYGMFLEGGEKTEAVDVMHYLWTGSYPENRAPQIQEFELQTQANTNEAVFAPGDTLNLFAQVTDPEGDELEYVFELLAEVPVDQQSEGGDFEKRPDTLMRLESDLNAVKLPLPSEPGEYRVFVYAFDSQRNAATANIPILIR